MNRFESSAVTADSGMSDFMKPEESGNRMLSDCS